MSEVKFLVGERATAFVGRTRAIALWKGGV